LFNKLKIAHKVWVYTLIIIIFITSTFYIYFKSSLENYFKTDLENKASTLIQTAASNLGTALNSDEKNYIPNILSALENDSDISFIYIANQKKEMRYGYQHYSLLTLIEETLNSNQIKRYEANYYIVKKGIFFEEKYLGDIIVGFNLDWMNSNINRIHRNLLYLSLILAMFLIGVSYLFARRFANPIKNIATTINNYSDEDGIDLRVEFTCYEEYRMSTRFWVPDLWIGNYAVELGVKGAKTKEIIEIREKIYEIIINEKEKIEK